VTNDPRQWPANGRVAHVSLQGRLTDVTFSEGQLFRVQDCVADLMSSKGRRERQLVSGEAFLVLETHDDLAFGFAMRDCYVGYMHADTLADQAEPTHRVAVRATHLFEQADIKSQDICSLSFGSLVRIVAQTGRLGQTHDGYFVPMVHLQPIDYQSTDPVAIAESLTGTPYLWGGNSSFGIDCSGLVQTCHLACGIACPGDSDQQADRLGEPVAPDQPVARGDLFFWKGHVAMAVDSTHLIHANAFQMAVATENIGQTIDRVRARGEGDVIIRRRIKPRG